MADKLKELLASQTKEEFLRDWEEVEAFGYEGPNALDYLNSIQSESFIMRSNQQVEFTTNFMENVGYNSPYYCQAA
ncbi:MAG: hypothetical protein AB2L20_28985 [Mangrovibacterium sp.]